MKYKREIKVAVLAIVCIFLLYFGFSFLKGVNIFSSTNSFVGKFADVGGLTEQAPVYVRGYKVGQVDAIRYDFTQDEAFSVQISMNKDIVLPHGSRMILADDGLLGGKAIVVRIPVGGAMDACFSGGDSLPTSVETGLLASLEEGLVAHVDSVVMVIDEVISEINKQLEGNHLQNTLQNVDHITTDLKVSASDIRQVTHQRVPGLMDSAQVTINHANAVLAELKGAHLKSTIDKLDTTVTAVNRVLTTKQGTVGLLLNDKALYHHIDSAVVSVDSLVSDLKANPKRYLHLSLFEKKEKTKSSCFLLHE